MKPDKLNNVFEALSPSEEQKKRMFDNIMSMREKPQKNKKVIFAKFALTASVAAVVVAIGIGSLSNKTGTADNPRQNGQTIALNQPDVSKNNSTDELYNEALAENETNEKSREKVSPVNESVLMDTAGGFDYTVTSQPNETALGSVTSEDAVELSEEIFETEATMQESVPAPSQPEPESGGEQLEASADVDNESVSEDNILLDDEELSMVTVSGSSSGGGAGGGGGGVAAKENSVKSEYLRDYPEFAQHFPNYVADGFMFYKMSVGDEFHSTFLNSEGKKITVTVAQKAFAEVITPEQIETVIQDGVASFALQCGEYYVTYYAETENADELHTMAVSSEYFK